MAKFSNIPRYTPPGDYVVDVSWRGLESTLKMFNVDMEPDFQRGHVWTLQQQRDFIWFLMRGGRTSNILFNCPEWPAVPPDRRVVLVDGLQRLTACLMWINKGLRDPMKRLVSAYKDFPWNSMALRFEVNRLRSREDVLRWYLEVNSGGTPHTREELERVRALLRRERTRRQRPNLTIER